VAAGLDRCESGSVEASGEARLLGPDDALPLPNAPVLLIDQALARHDALVSARAVVQLGRIRRSGSTVLLVSHDEELLLAVSDEIWWLDNGRLAGRGDPSEILAAYRRHIASRLRAWEEGIDSTVTPRMRRGDGRARIVAIWTVGENGSRTAMWRSGELALVKVEVRFERDVADPVVGMMIRTRIGLNVYGTNTELEKLKLGPCFAGETLEIHFAFRCELCPGEYSLTVASHDPDGVWHDWMEDAVAFSVSDSRYTAGVANLRATASVAARKTEAPV
jgi:lipopolysaccharide transport system ATP-binding protein